MRRTSINLRAAITLIVLCFGLPPAAKAQENVTLHGGSPAMNYSRDLLKRTDVQNELGLDAVQKEALEKALRKSDMPIVVRPVANHRNISRLSDAGRKQWQTEIDRQAANDAAFIINERQRELEEILRPGQRERLREIDLQWRGILALGDKSLSNRLGVSPEHQERIAHILAKFFLERLPLLNPHEESAASNSPRYQKRRVLLQETQEKVLALLSDEEKGRWTQAIGKPFKFDNLIKF